MFGRKLIRNFLMLSFAVGTVTGFLTGCGAPPQSGGSSATVAFGGYTAKNDFKSLEMFPKLRFMALAMPMILPEAKAATSSISLCIRRVRFKAQGESDSSSIATDDDNDDLSHDNRVGSQGWLVISSSGTFGVVNVPHPKVAVRMRIDVDNHCTGHPAASFNATNGSYSTNSNFTMEFDSAAGIDLTKANNVTLGWQAINNALNALAAAASDSSIVSALSTIGSM